MMGMSARFSAHTGTEQVGTHHHRAPQKPTNLAPHADASPAWHGDAEEHLEHVNLSGGLSFRHKRGKGGGVFSSVGDSCLSCWHHFTLPFMYCSEHVVSCWAGMCGNYSRKQKMLVMAFFGTLAAFIYGIVVIVANQDSGSFYLPGIMKDPAVPPKNPFANPIHEHDPVRLGEIRDFIIQSGFTSEADLDKADTPQNLALKWLTDHDPAELESTDVVILQRYALCVFYFSTVPIITDEQEEEEAENDAASLAQWDHGYWWMSEKGICMWYGVYCDDRIHEKFESEQYNENSDILHLNLTDNGILGNIPSEIAALENLQSLDLSHNQLGGRIPGSLGQLRLLEQLMLSENRLVGPIPESLKWLQKLHSYGLDGNQLTGPLPILLDFNHIRFLYLNGNQFTGTIPNMYGTLETLMELRLGNNNLHGEIPDELGNLSHLEVLYLDSNALDGTLPDFFEGLPHLEDLQVYKNELSGPLPPSIGELTALEILYLDNNEFTGSIPPSYGQLSALHILFLDDNELSGPIPNSLGGMKELHEFRVYRNELTGTIPDSIGTLFKLEVLYLGDNKLTGTVPDIIGDLGRLRELKLYGNNFSGAVPELVCALKKHYSLDVLEADCAKETGIVCNCCDSCY